ncbi:hypothetical protein [Paraburkholderia sp. WC7.3g]|uniref:hypothetical protein n=1 Tax=Paraburkholderia sp. WC7.3g TaxID=2991070 RepID=UPI003D1A3FFA
MGDDVRQHTVRFEQLGAIDRGAAIRHARTHRDVGQKPRPANRLTAQMPYRPFASRIACVTLFEAVEAGSGQNYARHRPRERCHPCTVEPQQEVGVRLDVHRLQCLDVIAGAQSVNALRVGPLVPYQRVTHAESEDDEARQHQYDGDDQLPVHAMSPPPAVNGTGDA